MINKELIRKFLLCLLVLQGFNWLTTRSASAGVSLEQRNAIEVEAAGFFAPKVLGIDRFLLEGRGLQKAPSIAPDAASAGLDILDEPASSPNLEALFNIQIQSPLTETVQITLVKTTDMSLFEPPSSDPSGVAYLSHLGTLLVSDSEVEKLPGFTGENVFKVSLSGTLLDAFSTIPFSYEPTGVAYNPFNRHLYFSDDDWKRIFELNPGIDGLYFTVDDILTWFSTSAFDCIDPEGVAFDNLRGHLFIVCGRDNHSELSEAVYEVAPGINGIFDGVSPSGDDQVSHFDLGPLGLEGPEGIEFTPDYHSLLILGEIDEVIAETTPTGSLIRLIDISSLGAMAPAGLAYAPASDDPSQNHIYIVDRGKDNSGGPDFNDGKLYEVAVPPRPLFKLFMPVVDR